MKTAAIVGVLGATLVGVIVAARSAETTATTTTAAGAPSALYDRYCLACHGATGDGAGPAAPWLWPKPRDFTRGRFKWRSTPSGKPPTDDDLAAVIRAGAPGTSMPAFDGILDAAQVKELVSDVKSFAPARFAKAAAAIAVPATPKTLDAKRGQELWTKAGCVACHGESGRGDGPSAAKLVDDAKRPAPPFDLTREPLRRATHGVRDIYLTLATGLDGTVMPSFGALAEADLWALAAYVDSIRATGARATSNARPLDARATQTVPLGFTIAAQGDPPASLPPAAASLSSAQCGRCHAKQLREWSTSLHSQTASPGLLAQFVGADDALVSSCLRCHAPLAEQHTAGDLQNEGATCAGCHVRNWTRRGPPLRKDSGLLAIASYPFVEDPTYERSDLCLPCHQLAPGTGVNGRPLLDTYREWLEGPYMRRGVQCQHCHMPDREHTWKGAHDPTTVGQAFAIAASVHGDTVTVTVKNVGAGHFAPTTATPAGFLTVTLVDDHGKAVSPAQTQRIGRDVAFVNGAWVEREDSRIPPGDTLTFAPHFAAVASARAAHVTFTFEPDAYYAGFYRAWLRTKLPAAQRALFQAALDRAEKSGFTVWDRTIPLPVR